jgi:hypothetical protein
MAAAKKRKVTDENRVFQSKWTEDHFFVCVKQVAVCLVCNGKISCFKEYNIKRHHETNHLSSLQGQSRKDKINQLQKCLTQQQNLFKVAALRSDTAVRASYVVSEILAPPPQKMKTFSDGEIIKECESAVTDIAFPDKKNIEFLKLVYHDSPLKEE